MSPPPQWPQSQLIRLSVHRGTEPYLLWCTALCAGQLLSLLQHRGGGDSLCLSSRTPDLLPVPLSFSTGSCYSEKVCVCNPAVWRTLCSWSCFACISSVSSGLASLQTREQLNAALWHWHKPMTTLVCSCSHLVLIMGSLGQSVQRDDLHI